MKPIELTVVRIKSEDDYTIGTLLDETGVLFCHTIEDEYREKKIKKETRIPEKRYKLGIQEALTPKTLQYRKDKRFKPWFDKHIQILDVHDFVGVYIHVGNTDDHTEGCLLLGSWDGKSPLITDSVKAFTKFYKKYYPLLRQGREIYLTIKTVD